MILFKSSFRHTLYNKRLFSVKVKETNRISCTLLSFRKDHFHSQRLEKKKERGLYVPETKWSDAPYSAQLFETLDLSDFNEEELGKRFDSLDIDGNGYIELEEVAAYLKKECESDRHCIRSGEVEAFSHEFMRTFVGTLDGKISKKNFIQKMKIMATNVDHRVWPIASSMLLTGLSIGIITPIMPLFVKQLGLTTSAFGIVVSAFAFTKLLGNIPCAFFSDRFGRKPFLSGGMGLIAIGMFGVSFASSFEELVLARLISGFGVSAFTTGSTLYLLDIGTPLNRTKTIMPVPVAFSAGASIGPAIGGLLAGYWGIEPTFFLVGAGFGALMLFNHLILAETLTKYRREKTIRQQTPEERESLAKAFIATLKRWKGLFANQDVRLILGTNFVYWIALSGANMTLLPMMLVDENRGFNLATHEIGGVFAMMSAVNLVCSPFTANFIDKYGKQKAIVGGLSLASLSMIAFPYQTDLPSALAILALWSFSGTVISLAPTSRLADVTTPEERSQAVALQRTIGDIGLLLGSSGTGKFADLTSHNTAMQVDGAFLSATTAWFAAGSLAAAKRSQKK